MGEHLAAAPYESNFKIKNINLVRHLICEELNSVTIWEADLRGSNDLDKIKRQEKLNREYYSNLRKRNSINS